MSNENVEKVKRLVAELVPDAPLGSEFPFFSKEGQLQALRHAEAFLQKVKEMDVRRYTHPDDIPFRNALIREFEEKIAEIKREGERMDQLMFDSDLEKDMVIRRLEDLAYRLRSVPVKEQK